MWVYQDIAKVLPRAALLTEICLYCSHPLTLLPPRAQVKEDDRYTEDQAPQSLTQVAACPKCGWWKLIRICRFPTVGAEDHEEIGIGSPNSLTRAAMGSLKELDLRSLTEPIEAVRAFLTARFNARFQMHPRLFEETVASVFADQGYDVCVTNYSGDDGIDIILYLPDGTTTGVQVKRHKNKISVEQIRALTGALLIGDHTRGVFVTTSSFQSGADRTVSLAAARGKPIILVDANSFYSALEIAQQARFDQLADPDYPLIGIHDGNLRIVDAP